MKRLIDSAPGALSRPVNRSRRIEAASIQTFRTFRAFSICSRCLAQQQHKQRQLQLRLQQRRQLQTATALPSHLDAPPAAEAPSSIINKNINEPGAGTSPSPSKPAILSRLTTSYSASPPPTVAQLNYANHFFLSSKLQFLLSSPRFRILPRSSVPEVCFIGRSNVGKSSLLNALVNRTSISAKLANTSKRPGRTRTMNAFAVGNVVVSEKTTPLGAGQLQQEQRANAPRFQEWAVGQGVSGGLVVLDMPGYGKGSTEEWGTEIVKYLSGRKELRRTFILINAEHGIKENDEVLLEMLRQKGIQHQVVLSKVDNLIAPTSSASLSTILSRIPKKLDPVFKQVREKLMKSTGHGVRPVDDIVAVSCKVVDPTPQKGMSHWIGLDSLRWAVLSATGLGCDETGFRSKLRYNIQEDGNNNDDDIVSWDQLMSDRQR